MVGRERGDEVVDAHDPPDSGEVDAGWDSAEVPAAPPPDQRATVPPPVPATEYVARMMGTAPASGPRAATMGRPSLAERHRAILETIHEEDPLQFDLREAALAAQQPPTAPPRTAPWRAAEAAPSIEMSLEAPADLDPELLKETPVPPKPQPIDELDELPIDDLLMGMAGTGAARAALDAPPVPMLDLGSMDVDLNPQSDPRAKLVDTAPPPASAGAIEIEIEDEESPYGADHGDRLTIPGFDPDNKLDQIQDRFVVGDYSGALVLAEAVLEEDASNSAALQYAESCRDMLRQMYLARLGDGAHVPRVLMGHDAVVGLTLDHRAGFLLSCCDGTSSIDEILDVCGMPPLDALRILFELLQEGVVVVEANEPSSSRRR